MGSTGTGRLLESAISREWARARIEDNETERYRIARGLSSNHTPSKETFVRQTVDRSNAVSMDETND